MPLFRYYYREPNGKLSDGTIEAECERNARSELTFILGGNVADTLILRRVAEDGKKRDTSHKRPLSSRKVDYESWDERGLARSAFFFNFLGFICLGFALYSLGGAVLNYLGLVGQPGQVYSWLRAVPAWVILAAPFALIGGLLTALRKGLDVHYFLDTKANNVVRFRRFFDWESQQKIARFSELECLAVGGRFVSESRGRNKPPLEYWLRALFLVTKSGKNIRISDFTNDFAAEELGKSLSEHLDLKLVIPESTEERLQILKNNGEVEIRYRSGSGCLASIFDIGGSLTGCFGFLGLVHLLLLAHDSLTVLLFPGP